MVPIATSYRSVAQTRRYPEKILKPIVLETVCYTKGIMFFGPRTNWSQFFVSVFVLAGKVGPIGPRTNRSYHSLFCTIDHRQTDIVVSLTMMPSSPHRSGDCNHQGGGGRDHHGGGVFKPP